MLYLSIFAAPNFYQENWSLKFKENLLKDSAKFNASQPLTNHLT